MIRSTHIYTLSTLSKWFLRAAAVLSVGLQERVWDVLLHECTERLSLTKAARRIFCETGAEISSSKDIINEMHIFVSMGGPFISKPAPQRVPRFSAPRTPGSGCSTPRKALSPSHKSVYVVQNGSEAHADLMRELLNQTSAKSELAGRLPSTCISKARAVVLRSSLIHLLLDATHALKLNQAAHRAFHLNGDEIKHDTDLNLLVPACCLAISFGEAYSRPDISHSIYSQPRATTPRFTSLDLKSVGPVVNTPRLIRRVQVLAHPCLWSESGVLTHTKQVVCLMPGSWLSSVVAGDT